MKIMNNDYSSTGYLQIKAFSANEAMPTPFVTVRISGNDSYTIGIERVTVTGRSGLSEKIALPAPEVELSQAPNPSEQPYATYDVEASADGYYSKKILNVAVFAGILSILPLQMIPNAGITNSVTPPTNSNYSISYENEELE